ncbi:hypothetical protein N7492_009589 [Penicillium capsulatum]|uniref:Uncharacterized protein n=1 Tax=Penicillium capsulatum TaxID=69766 RepID=A0A9W9HVL0_9EURO|nr:hypothetical protein N7492_009589 [Penicillium capsulatum]KAJ6106977.1 hypothetical protein N7512_010494 [Penicillium capsulatum]
MESSTGQDAAVRPLASTNEPGYLEAHIHSLTAKFFLNRPLEELIPKKFVRMAEQRSLHGAQVPLSRAIDGCYLDQGVWSRVDRRYRAVFRALSKAPAFQKGLWENGSEECGAELGPGDPKAQAKALNALMDEVGMRLDIFRQTEDKAAVFYLRSRLVSYDFEYWTGYRQRHFDAPSTSGCLALMFDGPGVGQALPVVPVSTTLKEEPLTSNLEGKFKIILAQFLMHIRKFSSLPGDKLPDQEVFLIGMHGGKFHLMRAFFPGQKVSRIWCQREVAGLCPIEADEDPEVVKSSPPPPPNHPVPRREQYERKLERARLFALDNELDRHTFRVLATREYNLWDEEHFTTVVQLIVALETYLMSGQAVSGILMETFRKNPIPRSAFRPMPTMSRQDAAQEPKTDTQIGSEETDTYFDSDSEVDLSDWDDDASFDDFGEVTTARPPRDESRQEERQPTQTEEHLRDEDEELTRQRNEQVEDRREIRRPVGGHQAQDNTEEEVWWDIPLTDDESGWSILSVADAQEHEDSD